MLKKSLLIMLFIVLYAGITSIAEENIREQFEEKYKAWNEYISRPELKIQSRATTHFTCPQFQEIVKLGVPALPYIADKIETVNDQLLWKAIGEIAKVKIHGKYSVEKNMLIFPDFPDLKPREDVYLYWYRSGRKQTPQRFESLFQEWKTLQSQGKAKEAKDKYQKIKDLGVDALPYMVKKIEDGDVALIPAISELTDGELNKSAKQSECTSWWQKNKDKWTLPSVE